MVKEKQANTGTRQDQREMIISYMALRQMIGWLGILLPVIVVVMAIVLCNCEHMQPSISDYYYTKSGDFFVGILWVLAFFLFAYRGHAPIDDMAANFAGAFALGVASFPTTYNGDAECLLHNGSDCSCIGIIHIACAVLLFITFALMSYYLFTRSDVAKGINPRKDRRNKVYRRSAIVMGIAILIMILDHTITPINDWLAPIKPTFYLEAVCLLSFGISWLTKGQLILKDKEPMP